jgi:hypothetical protein
MSFRRFSSYACVAAFGAIKYAIPSSNMDAIVKPPTFGNSPNTRNKSVREMRSVSRDTFDKIVLISGGGNPELSKHVSDLLDIKLASLKLGRFADGEVSLHVDENMRGKHVYVMQSCSAPVNENVMELLLLISCAHRSGASKVTAIIPYFGYKHHRRSISVSTKYQSRFLSSVAMDFAKMLETMGVDSVVSVDIQRPGQGQEACFFSAHVPLECIVTTNLFVDHIANHELDFKVPIVVVAPNAESLTKASKFQIGLQKHQLKNPPQGHTAVKIVGFFSEDAGTGYNPNAEMLGTAKVFLV